MKRPVADDASRPPVDPELVQRCREIPTATWSDALDQLGIAGVLPTMVRRSGALPIAGPIVTVDEAVGPLGSASPSDFGIDRILHGAERGDVLLIRQRGVPAASALGGLAARSAVRHGVAGAIIDGACRDIDELRDTGLPVLSGGVTPASGRGRVQITGVNVNLDFGEVEAHPGDVAVADETGVVLLPLERLAELLHLAEVRARRDAERATELTNVSRSHANPRASRHM